MRSQFSNGCLAFILLIIKRSQANPIRQLDPIEYQKPKEEKEYVIKLKTTKIIRRVPRELFGINIVYCWENDANWNETYWAADAIQGVDIAEGAFWRYPGGEVTSYTHWDNMTGRGFMDSWDPASSPPAEPDENWMSINEYADNIRNGGGRFMLGVNTRSGWKYHRTEEGLEEAKRLAIYANEQGWNVEYWFLDNEQYSGRKDNWSEEMYAYHINMYADVVRKYQPKAMFIANWHRTPSRWDKLLKLSGTNIAMMDIHAYWNRDGWGTLIWEHYTEIDKMRLDHERNTIREHVDSLLKVAHGHDLKKMKVGFLEWGVGPSPKGNILSRFQSAIVAADLFMNMIDSKLSTANYWPYRVSKEDSDRANSALVDEHNEPTVVHMFLKIFKDIDDCMLFKTDSTSPQIHTLAGMTNKKTKIVLYILQKGNKGSKIMIRGHFIPNIVEAISYHAPIINGQPDTHLDYATTSVATTVIDGRNVQISVKAWSLTRVILKGSIPHHLR